MDEMLVGGPSGAVIDDFVECQLPVTKLVQDPRDLGLSLRARTGKSVS
jgi:hypothetical protein